MLHLREGQTIPCGQLTNGRALPGFSFFLLLLAGGSVFVPKATLPTYDCSAGLGQMLQWIWAIC